MVSIKGSGPLRRKMRAKEFLKSFFDSWESFYLSLDGELLSLFIAKNSPEPFFTISLTQLKRIHVEPVVDHHQHSHSHSHHHQPSAVIEDRYLVVLLTSSNDLLHLRSASPVSSCDSPFSRFPDRSARECWVRTIVHAVNQFSG
jgi:hypothetical protein